jgi:hypothetical protein
MLKLLRKYGKIYNIHIRIYSIREQVTVNLPELEYELVKSVVNSNKTNYVIKENNTLVHKTSVFKYLNVLRLIKKKGPTIGDCFTHSDYRGKAIYPRVINKVSNELLASGQYDEVFIIVNDNNISSIIGIEKAGYQLNVEIISKKFLLFYFNTQIKTF